MHLHTFTHTHLVPGDMTHIRQVLKQKHGKAVTIIHNDGVVVMYLI